MRADRLLDIAWGAAIANDIKRPRNYRFAAVGLRADGKIVTSFNEKVVSPTWNAHAEARLCKKLTPFSIVAIARVSDTGTWLLGKPCESCERLLRRVGVKKVLYTIDVGEFGCINL